MPIPGRVVDALQGVLSIHRWGGGPDRFVFFGVDSHRRPCAVSVITNGLRKACKAAGVAPGRTFHCFRHTFISHASRSLSPAALRYHVGHTNVVTNELYQHVTAEDREQLVQAQQLILGGQP